VQVYSSTVERIALRFLTPEDLVEVNGSANPLHLLHILWGAKECMYKAYGKRKIGFREHLFISGMDLHDGKAVGEIRYEGLHLWYDIYFRLLPDVVWVYCLEHAGPVAADDQL
jgi:phosphopantetheinyl transferase (holo-ACP synthase)